jgi:SAM-dependent methyltransferase
VPPGGVTPEKGTTGDAFDAREYWERRLRLDESIRAVGHRSYSLEYNQWLYRRKEQCLARALSGVRVRHRRVLDVGCGTGFFTEWYQTRGARVTGVDITKVSVERLRKRFPDARFKVADVTDASFEQVGTTYDIVNVFDVLYHVVDDRRFEQALHNLASCCIEGGLLLLTDRFASPGDAQPAPHVKTRHLARYQSILPGLGLHLVALLPLYAWLNADNDPEQESRAGEYFDREETHARIAHDNLSLAVWQREPSRSTAPDRSCRDAS